MLEAQKRTTSQHRHQSSIREVDADNNMTWQEVAGQGGCLEATKPSFVVFSASARFPASGPLRDRAAKLLSLERQLFGAWCSYLFRALAETLNSLTIVLVTLGKPFRGPEMPLIGGSERDFTSALQAVDSELAKNTAARHVSAQHHKAL